MGRGKGRGAMLVVNQSVNKANSRIQIVRPTQKSTLAFSCCPKIVD